MDKEWKDEDGIGLVSQDVVDKAYGKAVTQIDRKRTMVYRWKKEFQRGRGDGVEDRIYRISTRDGTGESPARAKIPPRSQNQDYVLWVSNDVRDTGNWGNGLPKILKPRIFLIHTRENVFFYTNYSRG